MTGVSANGSVIFDVPAGGGSGDTNPLGAGAAVVSVLDLLGLPFLCFFSTAAAGGNGSASSRCFFRVEERKELSGSGAFLVFVSVVVVAGAGSGDNRLVFPRVDLVVFVVVASAFVPSSAAPSVEVAVAFADFALGGLPLFGDGLGTGSSATGSAIETPPVSDGLAFFDVMRVNWKPSASSSYSPVGSTNQRNINTSAI